MIVIDEAHVILSSRDFRDVMSKMTSLVRCKVPLTLLTATLPPRLERPLIEACNLPNHTSIRVPSDRKEHQYTVREVEKKEVVGKTFSFIAQSTKILEGSRRGIIFVRSKAIGQDIKSLLPGVDFVSGEVTDEKTREAMIQRWKSGRSKGWIIGTTCLIQGLNYPNVHLVVFAASPWGLIDFVQGAGRGGRNGAMSRIVLIHSQEGQSCPVEQDLVCANEMVSWVANTSECRRLGILRCMDGGTITCQSLEGAIDCDICRPDADVISMLNTKGPPTNDSTNPPRTPLPLPRVALAPPTNFETEPLTQLDMPELRPQPACSTIIRASEAAIDLQDKRKAQAKECVLMLQAFGDNCGVCHVKQMTLTGEQHPMCLNKCGLELSTFYDWNKPLVRMKEVWRLCVGTVGFGLIL